MRLVPPFRPPADERGFVLGFVLFAVAALTVTVSAALLLAQSERLTGSAEADTSRSLHLAQAGLTRFLGRHGVPPDSVIYDMGGGRVVVHAERVATRDTARVFYVLTSRSSLPDARHAARPARSEVRQFAELNRRPLSPNGAVITTARNIYVANTSVSGHDQSVSGQCESAVRGNIAGVNGVAGGYVTSPGGSISGKTSTDLVADTATLRQRLGVRWEEVTSPAASFEHEFPTGAWPDFSTMAIDEFPVVRVTGDFTATDWRSGRGLLIVDGRLTLQDGFQWDGIVMAGSLANPTLAAFDIDGILAAGMAQTAGTMLDLRGGGDIRYDACAVLAAAEGLATLTPLRNTWWENARL